MILRFFVLALIAVVSIACSKETSFSSGMPPMANIADILRSENQELGALLNDPALTAVTREYGATVIAARQLPYRSPVAVADVIPWSSWWYPKKEDLLFANSKDRLSPLTKYDLVRQYQMSSQSSAAVNSATTYEQNSFNKNSQSWEGHCDAWAIASISKPEPRRPVTFATGGKPVTFSVSDLKALLIKTYEAVEDTDLKYYGQKFTGDYRGWIYPDIFPDQFHRFVEVQLFERHKAFIIDHDPSVQVWNVPVFKANYQVASVAGEPDSVFVRTWIYSAEPALSSEKDSVIGTKETVREYNYILKGTRDGQGNLVIHSGYWTIGADGVNSRRDHPDYLIAIPDTSKLSRKSWNPEIDVGLVDSIVSQSY